MSDRWSSPVRAAVFDITVYIEEPFRQHMRTLFYVSVSSFVATIVATREAQGQDLIQPPPARALHQGADSQKQGLNIEIYSNVEIDVSDKIFQFI